MPERKYLLLPGNYYHIYNRGVNKEAIFFFDHNYQFFIERMFAYLTPNSEIIAYCLMPNHYHLLLQVNSIDFVKQNLQLFLMSFSKAINIERERVGPLFQGRFQANPIEDDGHLLDCMKYIHVNPVKAGLTTTPELWPYSSYCDYLYENSRTRINTSIIMGFFNDIKEFQEFVEFEIDLYESKYFTKD